jgi:undecaprenyl-diphosphatase
VRITAPASLADRIKAFDTRADRALDELRPGADRLFYGASALGDHSLIWVMLAIQRGLRSDHHWQSVLRSTATIAAESALVNGPIKSMFRRARPVHEGPRPLALRRPRTSSFPSGHATAAFVAASILSDGDPLWPLYYAAAVVVSTSRAYVKIHHASDVVGGIAVGLVLGRIARRIAPLPPLSGSPRAGINP